MFTDIVRRTLCLATVAGALLASSTLWAEEASPGDLRRARALYRQGVAQFDGGEPDAALRSFRESYELHPHTETLYNIATVLGRLAQYREAIEAYRRYTFEASTVAPARAAEVDREIRRMESLLGSLTVRVSHPGATIAVDGTEVGTSPLETPLRVNPGDHVITARLDGFEEHRAQVSLTAGGEHEVSLELVARAARLTVTGSVPGAVIEVDGEAVGTFPLDAPVELAPGHHTVRATAEGFETTEREVEATPGADLRVEMYTVRQRPLPVLSFAGEEAATVSIDGEAVGQLPWEGDVQPGNRVIEIAGQGLNRWEGEVSLRRGDRTEVEVRLGRGPSGPAPAWIWAFAGVAVAAGASALGFGLAAMDRNSDFDAMADRIQAAEYADDNELARWQDRGQALADEARGFSLACDISWITAAVTGAISVVLAIVRDWGEEGPNVTFSTIDEAVDAEGEEAVE